MNRNRLSRFGSFYEIRRSFNLLQVRSLAFSEVVNLSFYLSVGVNRFPPSHPSPQLIHIIGMKSYKCRCFETVTHRVN